MLNNFNTLDQPQTIVVQAPDVTVNNEYSPPSVAAPVASIVNNITGSATGTLQSLPSVVQNLLDPAGRVSVNAALSLCQKNILELHLKLEDLICKLRACGAIDT